MGKKAESDDVLSIKRKKLFLLQDSGNCIALLNRTVFLNHRELIRTVSLSVDDVAKDFSLADKILGGEFVDDINGSLFPVEERQGLVELLSTMVGKRSVADEVVYWQIKQDRDFELGLERLGRLFKRRRALHVMPERDLDWRSYRILRRNGFQRLRGSGLILAGGVGRFVERRMVVEYRGGLR
jgi:hypothetical protein